MRRLALLVALASLAAAPPQRPTAEQKRRFADALALLEKAESLHKAGRHADALPLLRKVHESDLDLFGPLDFQTADTLALTASVHAALGRFDDAAGCFLKRGAAMSRLYGAGHWRHREAEEARRDALRLRDATPEARAGGKKAFEAQAKFGAMARAGDFEDALAPLREAQKLTRALYGEKSAKYARLLANEGVALRNLADHAGARKAYDAALAVLRPALGEVHPDTLNVLNNLAAVLHFQGHTDDAMRLMLHVLRAREADEGRTAEWAMAADNLGVMALKGGQAREALKFMLHAIEVRRRLLGPGHAAVGDSLVNLSAAYTALADRRSSLQAASDAVEVYREALGPRHPKYAQALMNLGASLASAQEYDEAGDVLKKALVLCRAVHGKRHPQTAAALELVALWHADRGGLTEARPLFEEARAIRKAVFGTRSPEYASTVQFLASVEWGEGRRAEAEKLAREAMAVFRRVPGDPRLCHSLTFLAGCSLALKKPDDARRFADESISLARRRLDLAATVQAEQQQLEALEEVGLYLHMRLSVPEDDAAAGHAHLLGWKGAVFAGQQHRRRMARLAQAGGEAARIGEELGGLTRRLAALALAGDVDAEAGELAKRRMTLEAALAERNAPPPPNRPVPSAAVAARLPDGAVLLDWLVQHRFLPDAPPGAPRWQARINVWVLRRGVAPVRVDLGLAGEAERLIDGWRQDLEAGRTGAGGRVAERLWTPLRKHVAGAKMLLVSPDGPLTRLPWAALPGSKAGTALIEEVPVVMVPAPSRLEDTPPRPGRVLAAVGGVDFGIGGRWPALPAAGPEAEAAARRFKAAFPDGRVETLSGTRAGREAVRAALAKASHAHFATHGYFLAPERERPLGRGGWHWLADWNPGLRSGLVLSGANRPGSDGGHILTALEAAEMDLSGLDLAVLSACQTGLGKEAGGEGMLGLQRAFQVAGCRSVVSSLWSVNDAATGVLMRRFYSHLWEKKLSKAEALRQAQLDVMRHPEWVEAEVKRLGAMPGLRGVGKAAERVPAGGKAERISPPAWWAAWQLSGAWL